MPIEQWTAAQVLALAPDASSKKGAQGVSSAAKWAAAGLSADLLWGLCRGSGKNPYQACIDLTGPAYRCSCPSRKFPCKHTLGLLLLWSTGGVDEQPAPVWVEEWRESRAARVAEATARAERSGPADEAAARKRAEQRVDRVAVGMAELDRWLLDQVTQGLAHAPRSGPAPYEAMAARLVDAQAPAVANVVRRLGQIVGIGPHWADHLLGELALLRLLVTGHARLDRLSPALAATVRTRIGIPVTTEQVLATTPLRDHWLALGHVDVVESQLTARRNWLYGIRSGRFALVLSFAAPGQRFPADIVPGGVVDAELCFYPEALPLRALVAVRHGPITAAGAPAGATPIRAAMVSWSEAVAADPWIGRIGMLLADVVPTSDGYLVDQAGDALALSHGDTEPWWLLAATGGQPVTVAGEYGQDGFRPLAAWPHGRYVPVPAAPTGVRRDRWMPPNLLSAALVGTERQPFSGTAIEVGDRRLRSGGTGASALLESAAVALTYHRAGAACAHGKTPIEPPPAETQPLPPDAAAHRLASLLGDDGESAPILLAEWLHHAGDRGFRVPEESLPALLDAGRRHRALRPLLAAVAGRRGGWLAGKRPDWRYLLTEPMAGCNPDDWTTGTPGERLAHLVAVRDADPGAGLALLTATFDTEAPEDRARFLGVLATGLSLADEPLLERALCDRRKEVRRIAGELLSRLPGAAFGHRMAQRALTCVTLDRTPGHGDRLFVTPPTECDAALRRDGVSEKDRRAAYRSWLLEEIVARTPLDTWTTALARSADQLLALPVLAPPPILDWAGVLHVGLIRAAVTQQNPTWARALVEREYWSDPVQYPLGTDHARRLYALLPPEDLIRHVVDALRNRPSQVYWLLEFCPRPWPDRLAAAVVDAIRRLSVAGRDTSYVDIASWCRASRVAMPPGYANDLRAIAESLYTAQPNTEEATAVANLAATLALRQQIFEEMS